MFKPGRTNFMSLCNFLFALVIILTTFGDYAFADDQGINIAEMRQGLDISEHGMEAYSRFQVFSTT